MAENFESFYFSGQGPVFLADRDAGGNPLGFTFIGDIGEANLEPKVETVEVIENVSGTGGVGASFTRSVEYDLTMTMRSVKPQHLAQALQGNLTAKAAGNVVDESHTARADKFVLLAHPKVSGVVVTDSAGTTTYAAGTDYVLYADRGMIEILSTGAITDGQAILVDYSYAAQSHVAANPQNLEKYLTFAGLNRANNSKQTRCEIYRLKLDPGVLGMIQSDTAEMQITGRALIDSTRAAGDQFFSWKVED